MSFGWGYPPGVTGNEPQITGEWPCVLCGGYPAEQDEDGGWDVCPHCRGAGMEPEEFDVGYLEELVEDECRNKDVLDAVVQAVRYCQFDRAKPDDRRYLHAAARVRRLLREAS